MSGNPPCPSPAQLAALLRGQLSTDAEGPLTAHLDNCAACRARLERLAAGEDFSADVARQLGGDGGAESNGAPPQPLAAVMEQFAKGPPVGETRAVSRAATDVAPQPTLPADFPQPPAQLDRYQLIREIGRGGMGVVFAARDVTLDRQVAIKVLGPQWAADAVARQRFFAEARAAAAVNSRHVVTLHAVEDRGPWPYLVMEFVPGSNLQQLLDEYGPLPLPTILQIGTRVASGLAAAHQRGLVHRDIKPANVLVVKSTGQVKLTDFGLARAATDDRITKAGLIVGTLAYMAPEQWDGTTIDHRADLYALGCLFYAMCTGRAPIEGDNTLALLRRVIERRFTPLAVAAPHLPPWLVSIVERLMSVRPDDRIQSAAEVVELLRQQQAAPLGTPVPLPPPPAPPLETELVAIDDGKTLADAQPLTPLPPPAPVSLPTSTATALQERPSTSPASLAPNMAGVSLPPPAPPSASNTTGVPWVAPNKSVAPSGRRPSAKQPNRHHVLVALGAIVALSIVAIVGSAVIIRALLHEPGEVEQAADLVTNGQTPIQPDTPFVAPTVPPLVASPVNKFPMQPPAGPVPSGVGPFIEVQSGGHGPQRFHNLADAVNQAPHGAEIVIHGDQVWESPPLEIRNRALTIRAAAGQARVRFARDASFPGAMLQTDSALTLEALTLVDESALDATDSGGVQRPGLRRMADGLIATFGPELKMTRCRIGTGGRVPCVWVDAASRVELRNCQFSAPLGTVVTWRDIQQRGPERRTVIVEDCAARARVGLFLDVRHESQCEFTLARFTCLSDDGLHLELPSIKGPATSRPTIFIESQECVFDCSQLLSLWTHATNEPPQMKSQAARELPRYVVWRGRENLFPSKLSFLSLRPYARLESFEPPPTSRSIIVDDIAEWRELWPSADGNSRLAELRYGPRRLTKSELPTAEQAGTLPGGGSEFGARVGLVADDELRVHSP